MTTAITPNIMPKPVNSDTITLNMTVSRMAACNTSVLEKAVPAAKLRCENIRISKTVKIICVRLARLTQIQNHNVVAGKAISDMY